MIYAKTWVPGTDTSLDNLFEEFREKIYRDQQHPLWSNYTKEHFKTCSALTISFENDIPIFCSSILERKIWPHGVFRIMNRYWRIGNEHVFLKTISQGSAEMTRSQLEWTKKQPHFQLVFISRQYDHWQQFVINQFDKKYQIKFNSDNYKYLTCDNKEDDSCWQKIIYQGDYNVLNLWTRK